MSSSSSAPNPPVVSSTPVTLQPTAIGDIAKLHRECVDYFASDATKPLEFRRAQLLQLYKLVKENEDLLCGTENADLSCSKGHTMMCFFALMYNNLAEATSCLDAWTSPEYPSVPLVNKLDKCQIRADPKGVVLIIGAWNYPLQLTLVPLVGAIAAGCCAIIKPSELAPTSAMALASLLPKYLDSKAFKVVNGGVPETSKLLELKFDHILYTGNGQVARVVAAAAAKHLTPTTLELGGKSPVIVDKNVDVGIVARRITWGAFLNAGQTCIRPDYVLCPVSLKDALVAEIKKTLVEFYGADPRTSPDMARIVNARHFKRVAELIDKSKGKIELGNVRDEATRYIAPTVVTGVDGTDSLMQSEIFGPVLPVVDVQSIDQAIAFVKDHDKPLALYVFTNDKDVAERVVTSTSSGSVVVNDVLMQASVDTLPFGGVGESGMGAYHGKYSFDIFTHKKSMMVKPLALESVNSLRYPPLTDNKLSWLFTLSVAYPRQKRFWFF